ncbi:type I DNA topoisomerase [Patescibacteria group bacterium]|nr:type I DNA topoisomerase [Patescibacteria group bacterium]MBU1448407.1 type I DNA topoisomerase [Patescibacteria group bacterium]MBU2613440.1 type I DNA topoisomerase [Patescibacteria group bacterium]
MKLVIVESPTKAKTISRFLGKDYKVLASFGHVRDLPKSKLGVDVEHGFEPTYTVSLDHKAKVKEIKDAAKKATAVLFATDEDREGEAISWHLAQILGTDPKKTKRITFHEITREAIETALKNPRVLDMHLVDAQQARRVLDRLVGYRLSPFLWRTVRRGLSAGRVQSVAVRIIVEREREIKAFIPQEYWSIEGLFSAGNTKETFEGKLHAVGGKTLDKMAIATKEDADTYIQEAKDASFIVATADSKERKASPPPPFTTSTLQQEANHRLGFSAKQTMTIAQKLYEGIELGSEGAVGLITYMRTDSVNLAERFLKDATNTIKAAYGEEYALDEPRLYRTKRKTAQEAHEAIRPTDPSRTPDEIADSLDPGQLKLYRLIWQRALASQMPDAKLLGTSADLSAGRLTFRATGQRVLFDGYLKLYPDQDKDKFLPELSVGRSVTAKDIEGKQHFTEPAARYSDATLVKALEELDIGRPSTYAPTISTIIDRGYVERDDKKRLMPTDVAGDVTDILVKNFPDIVDTGFTARMENSLDNVAEGRMDWRPLIAAFYGPFEIVLKQKEASLEKEIQKEAEGESCPTCSGPMVVKRGRFGKFLACAKYPECKTTKPLKGEKPRAEPEPTDEICPTCDAPMVKKVGRYGPFLSCSRYPKCKTIKNIEKVVVDENGQQIACPACKTGHILERMSKKGKVFYACSRYPECDQAFWDRPNGIPCPKCDYPTLTYKGKSKIICPKEGCGYKADRPDAE